MNVNLVDIIILAVLGLSIFTGMYKGFIASGLSALGFVAAWLGAWYLFPYLSNALSSNESLMGALSYYLDANSLFASREAATALVRDVQANGTLTQILAELKLPSIIVNAFQTNVASQQFLSAGLTTMAEYLDRTIWYAIINIGSFIIMFAVSYIVVVLLINLLNAVFHFPLLRHFDWLLGGVFGFARGAVVVMLILAVIPLIESVVQLDVIDQLIQSSSLAHFFDYEFVISDVIRRAYDVT